MTLSIVAILAGISKLAFWGLILSFGIWTHRRSPFRSLPWLGVYLVLSMLLIPVTPTITKRLVDGLIAQGASPFGWTIGQFMATWGYWRIFIASLTKLVLGLLILSDMAFLVSKGGVEAKGRFLNKLLAVRERSVPLGLVMIILMLSSPMTSLVIYLHYA